MLLRNILVLVVYFFAAATSNILQTRHRRQIVFEDETTQADEPCVTPNRTPGSCIRLVDCPRLIRQSFRVIRRHSCGFEGNEPKVCCPGGRTAQTTPSTTRRPPRRTTRRPSRTTVRPIVTRPPPRIRTTTTATTTTVRPSRQNLSVLPRECGISNATLKRIVGGEESELGAWPWIAVIFVDRNGIRSADCGGALVTATHVITAAHCVVRGAQAQPMAASAFTVRLGEHDLYSNDDGANPIDIAVRGVKRHENFEVPTYKNDIAILTLERSVTFTRFIGPICLPFEMRDLDFATYSAFTCGWGTTSFNGPSSSILRQVQFPVWEQEECRQAYVREVPITDVYMCAGLADGSKDACQGDSGGPLMLPDKGRFNLVGVVSFGKLCAQPGYPGVYTRVTKFLDWISANLV